MSKIFKSVKKGVSKLWKGIKKVVKKVWKSKIGKIVLIAAAIYLGGWALGAWSGPGGAGGLLGGEGLLGGSGATSTLTTAAPGITPSVTVGGVTQGASVAMAAPAIAPTGAIGGGPAGTVGGLVPSTAPATPAVATAPSAPVAAAPDYAALTRPEAISGGSSSAGAIVRTIQNLGGGLVDFAKTPGGGLVAAMGISGIAGGFGAAAEQDAIDEERRRRERNMLVGNIDLGVKPSGRPLRRLSTGEPVFKNGIIRSGTA